MKKIILLLTAVIYSILSVNAQNWQTVRSGRIAYFDNDQGKIKCIRINMVTFEKDSVLYPMHNIEQYVRYCFSPYGNSWIGEKVIIQSNGINLFFNLQKDTIRIHTLSRVNESWTAFEIKDSIKVVAEVTKAEVLTVLGEEDSVKTIGFKVYNKNGLASHHYLNDKTLQLSKNNGFVRMMNFNEFPNVPTSRTFEILETFSLIGLTNPERGVQNLTWLGVNDYQVGDELHTLYEWSECCNKGDSTKIKTRLKYLERQENADSVVYSVAREQSIYKTIGLKDSISYVYVNDTIKQVYKPDPIFDKLPGEPIISDGSAFIYTMINENPVSKRDYSIFDRIHRIDNMCWYKIEGEACFAIPTWLKGLGGPYFSCTNPEGAGGGESSQLVYYKKGATTWGNLLVITDVKNLAAQDQVKIYPNPASDFILIENTSGKADKYVISLTDMQGREVLKNVTTISTTYKVDLSALTPGVYLLKLQNQETLFSKMLVKKP